MGEQSNRCFAVLLAGAMIATGCDQGPSIILAPENPPIDVDAVSMSFRVDLLARTVSASVAGGPAGPIVDDPGSEPSGISTSILGGDAFGVEVIDGSLDVGTAPGPAGNQHVSFDIVIRSRQPLSLRGPTSFPVPPPGSTTPLLVPLLVEADSVPGSVSAEGTIVTVSTPSFGEVWPSDSVWSGPPHNFFNDEPCGVSGAPGTDCYLYLPVTEAETCDVLGPLKASVPIRLTFDAEQTVHVFTARFLLAADVVDPTAAPLGGPCSVQGVSVEQFGSTLEVAWEEVTGATSYRVEVEVEDSATIVLDMPADTLLAVISGIPEQTRATASVVALNAQGEVRSESVLASPNPPVPFPDSRRISAGWQLVCALEGVDETWCWGHPNGGIGAGQPFASDLPVQIPAPPFRSIQVSFDTACGITMDGRLLCWGENRSNDALPGLPSPIPTPTEFPLPGPVAHLSLEYEFGCAILEDRTLWCWGLNEGSRLGLGLPLDRRPPTRVAGETRFSDVRVSENHTCGLTESGRVLCWGRNSSNELGLGDTAERWFPTEVELPERAVSLTPTDLGACALGVSGTFHCWGETTRTGLLGLGSEDRVPTPTPHPWFDGVRSLEFSDGFGCALMVDGTASCWGRNDRGTLGREGPDADVPVQAGAGLVFEELSLGFETVCGETVVGERVCWGSNFSGQHGRGDLPEEFSPVEVPGSGAIGFVEIEAGERLTCGLDGVGDVFCWGEQYLDGPQPRQISSGLGLSELTVGHDHACALAPDGSAYCWGSNAEGKLGVGSPDSMTIATAVSTSVRFVEVAANSRHTCAISTDQRLFCWGMESFRGNWGRPALVAYATSDVPVEIGPMDLSDLDGQEDFTCGMDPSGGVLCWGHNYPIGLPETVPLPQSSGLTVGSRGFNGRVCALDPVGRVFCTLSGFDAAVELVPGFLFDQIDRGDYHTCGIERSGRLSCWGVNREGRLGDGTETDSPNVPVAPALPVPVVDVGVGTDYSCAVGTDGRAFCWGSNRYGGLGLVPVLYTAYPRTVLPFQ